MDNDSKYFSKKKYIDTGVTLDEVLQFIKNEIKKGKFSKFKNSSEGDLLELARASKPLIKIQLETTNALAKNQIQARKRDKGKVIDL